jgi:hypothetical protein
MKKRRIFAFLLLAAGVADILDWMLFSDPVKNNKPFDFELYKEKYIEHLPAFLRPLYQPPIIITSICFLFFIIAGALFLKEQKKPYKYLAVFSFLLAFWELFSLM